MKNIKKLLCLSLLITIASCSSNDSSNVEDGVNKAPNLKVTGSSANGFLSASKYKSLVIEVNYAQNLAPNSQTLLNLKNFLEARLNKPNGVTIFSNQIPTQTGSPFTSQEISDIENTVRTEYNDGDVLKLHMLFLNGNSNDDNGPNKILGVAYRNTSCVLFENSIQLFSDQLTEPNRVDLETTVILHEVGHLLGLVNTGSNMVNNHLDTAHDKHCTNQNCLMFWQIENSGIMNMMNNGNVPSLDANCLLDLQANGGK
jgi:predicted Zn-dependent protease